MARTEAQNREGLVDAAEHRVVALEDLHPHLRVVAVPLHDLARPVEVRVGIITGAHLLDGKVEDERAEPLEAQHGTSVRIRGTPLLSWSARSPIPRLQRNCSTSES